jgi:hypothetical protein
MPTAFLVEEHIPFMRALCDKLTYVCYCLSEVLVDLLLSPPSLCFLELLPAAAEFATHPQVLTNVEPT